MNIIEAIEAVKQAQQKVYHPKYKMDDDIVIFSSVSEDGILKGKSLTLEHITPELLDGWCIYNNKLKDEEYKSHQLKMLIKEQIYLEEKINYLECQINTFKYHLSRIRDEADQQYEAYGIPAFARISAIACKAVEAVTKNNKREKNNEY
jgi:hypothetical protein